MAIPRLLDRLVSPAVRAQAWRLLELPERLRFRRHLERLAHVPRPGEPALHYGDALVPDAAGLVHGGRVKLLHLAEEFPETPDFNILYLVSSAPPKFALELVEWAQKRGVKIVWNQNGVAYPAWYGARAEEINAPMRALRARADYIFYQSAFCRDCATQFLGEVQVPGEIAFNSVDTERFRPVESPDASVCRLLATGSHHDSYRVITVLEAVAELNRRKFPVTLQLAGRLLWDGAEVEVAAKIAELGIADQVRRIPPYRQDEAPVIFQAAHILIHPKYKDPCPTVPIEAMACGVPVIGSASGGMTELVSADAGILLEVPESWEKNYWPAPTAMADAVQQIMDHRAEYAAGARANAVARFSVDKWLAQHRRVFQSLAPVGSS
jgi:glycosyltransferase involved in cell wall biosynthesis